ncbi:MAG: NAD-dependent epimerase/dehydratase family protein [Deltaproteobacteria bacterium]|nr:NAD-dependent epimerase/dehydratase family protein [Deltaproteobacteria bacterium]
MKILVTGGAGFIASHISDAYLAAGHEVVIVDDLSSGTRANLPAAAKFYHADIRSPEAREIIRNERPQVLSLHAAQMDVRKSVADPGFDAEVNVLGMINMLEAGREVGVRKVIFASSGGATYGEQEAFPAAESHPHNPLSPYGITKATGEHYLFFYHAVYGMPYVALRYANVYGPRQDPHGEAGVVAIFTEKLLAGQAPTINGDGKQTRDYVFVGDVVRANLAALDRSFVGSVNVGTGIETDVTTLYAHLRVLTGSPHPAQHGPAKAGEQRRSVIAIGRAAEVLGWRPEISLEEGLRRTVEFFRVRLTAR